VTAAGSEDGGNAPDAAITVELSIDDGKLAGRVRRLLMDDPGLNIVSGGGQQADLRITDGAVDLRDGARVIVLAAGPDAADAVHSGAAAVLSERAGADELGAAIRAVAQGLTVISDEFRDRLMSRDLDGLAPAEDEALSVELTQRESQVLALLADGASNKVIARALGVTPHTAKFHVASIIAKLGATGRTDAVARAMRIGLIMI
jgi:DNA-binding NarL/FixJ family response regulator